MADRYRLANLRVLIEAAKQDAQQLKMDVLAKLLAMCHFELMQSGPRSLLMLDKNDTATPVPALPRYIGTWDWDLEKNIVRVDPDVAALFGAAAEGPSSESLELFGNAVHADDYDRVWKAIDETITLGKIYDIEYRVNVPPDKECSVTALGRVIYNDRTKKAARFVGLLIEVASSSLTVVDIRKRSHRR